MDTYLSSSWVLIGPVLPQQNREIDWLIEELHETLTNLKHGLEDCYALLAPIDPGSTLVVSTHRNEVVKGHVTRVGTRIVKGVRLSFPSFELEMADFDHNIDDPPTHAYPPSTNPDY